MSELARGMWQEYRDLAKRGFRDFLSSLSVGVALLLIPIMVIGIALFSLFFDRRVK